MGSLSEIRKSTSEVGTNEATGTIACDHVVLEAISNLMQPSSDYEHKDCGLILKLGPFTSLHIKIYTHMKKEDRQLRPQL